MKSLLPLLVILCILSSSFISTYHTETGSNSELSYTHQNANLMINSIQKQKVLYLSPSNSDILQTAWNLSNSPITAIPIKDTSILINSSLSETGHGLFKPGISDAIPSGSPSPNKTYAYGWLSSFPINLTVPKGNWSMEIELNITQGSGLSGRIFPDAAIFSWNNTNQTFTQLAVTENSSINLENTTPGNHLINLSTSLPSIDFGKSDYLFVEFYLNIISFSSLTASTIVFNIGGPSASMFFIEYPDFGWLNGSVSPARSGVTVDGYPVAVSSAGVFNITLGPGDYILNATLAGYSNFTNYIAIKSGFSYAVDIVLEKLYVVDIQEHGLKKGTQWAVYLNGSRANQSTNYSLFTLINGTYSLFIPSVPGYRTGSYPSSIYVDGSNQTILVNFTVATFNVDFEETGLANSTAWSLIVSNSTFSVNYTINSTSGSMLLPNGTYNYSVMKVPGYSSSPSKGIFSVTGSATTVSVTFDLIFYRITFVENGLTSPYKWSVTLNGVTKSNNSTTITFYEPLGSYNYSIGTVKGYSLSMSSGKVSVVSGNLTVGVTFSPASASGNSLFFSKPLNLFYFAVILIILVQIEIIASFYYFRRTRSRSGEGDDKNRPGPNDKPDQLLNKHKPVSEMVEENSSQTGGAIASAVVFPSQPLNAGRDAEYGLPSDKKIADTAGVPQLSSILEYGTSFAFFEEKAEKSVQLFEIGLKKGLKGLCFTREYPDKLRQRHDLKDATVVWLSNIGSQDTIRPKDLEKITLQCNELLASSQSVILIDGLEYLITNNGFISVLKLLQFLRDATAVNRSVLIISINQHAIKDSEVSLIKREVDRIVD